MTGWPSGFVHTPYGTHKPFTIGMTLLDPDDWIETDAHLAAYLAEKNRLLAADRQAVFREEPDTRAAQSEMLAMLVEHLPARFPDIYKREGRYIRIEPAAARIDLEDHSEPPLVTATRLVQEDLVLMRKGEGGYRFAAGAVCFPSSWSLADKFGKTLDGLHTPVPGYADLLGGRVNRIFDHLKAEAPVARFGWSIHAEDALHHPHGTLWQESAGADQAFIRLERQTLRRLPVSGDILFTIRIHLDPLAALREHPEGARLAAAIREDLLALSDSQLAYRSLAGQRDRLAAALGRIAAGG